MKKLILIAGTSLLVICTCRAQSAQILPKNSGPLSFVSSDVNPKTVFWIQGRFVPVNDPKFQGDAHVVTILCSIREYECLEIDSDNLNSPDTEEAWIQEYRPVNWDKSGIVADSHSLDGCTDETLRIHFDPPSAVLIDSPNLPMSKLCSDTNNAMDKLIGKLGQTLKYQTEQDELVPTRGLLSFQDSKFGKDSSRAGSTTQEDAWLVKSTWSEQNGSVTVINFELENNELLYKAYCDSTLPSSFLVCTRLTRFVGQTIPDVTRSGDDSHCTCILDSGPNTTTGGDVLHFHDEELGSNRNDAVLFVSQKSKPR